MRLIYKGLASYAVGGMGENANGQYVAHNICNFDPDNSVSKVRERNSSRSIEVSGASQK